LQLAIIHLADHVEDAASAIRRCEPPAGDVSRHSSKSHEGKNNSEKVIDEAHVQTLHRV
jgi:hypothetical protein